MQQEYVCDGGSQESDSCRSGPCRISSLFCVLMRNTASIPALTLSLHPMRCAASVTCVTRQRARSVWMELMGVEEDDLSRSLIIDCLGYRQRCSSKSSARQSRSLSNMSCLLTSWFLSCSNVSRGSQIIIYLPKVLLGKSWEEWWWFDIGRVMKLRFYGAWARSVTAICPDLEHKKVRHKSLELIPYYRGRCPFINIAWLSSAFHPLWMSLLSSMVHYTSIARL